jgi:hypothetical protein
LANDTDTTHIENVGTLGKRPVVALTQLGGQLALEAFSSRRWELLHQVGASVVFVRLVNVQPKNSVKHLILREVQARRQPVA